MFDKIKKELRRREREKISQVLQQRLKSDTNDVNKRIAFTTHQINKLESDIKKMMTYADALKQQGKIDEARNVVYQTEEKDKALNEFYKSRDKLTVYGSKLKLIETRLISKENVHRALNKGKMFGENLGPLLQHYNKLSEELDELDMNDLESMLDSPDYNPITENIDYQMTRATIDNMSGETPIFKKYLNSFKEDLIKVKE